MVGGHAGRTYGFAIDVDGQSEALKVVLKMGTPGVKRVGASDLFRQASLLKLLGDAGCPVPRLVWAEASSDDLGAPYIVMERLRGTARFPLLLEPGESPPAESATLWSGALDALATLADPAVTAAISKWERPVALDDELIRWEATLRKSPDASWIDTGLRAQRALRRILPGPAQAHCISHGDFQPSNLLFDGEVLTGIIDWDLAQVAPPGSDLGWLMMFADAECWIGGVRPWSPYAPDELAARYCSMHPLPEPLLGWFRAFAGFRFGAIACLNVYLHRSGRRTDPVWEKLSSSIPQLFERSRQLAERASLH
jgi:aminoglycoside phosphotransferase (APT) family kinase protein